jgi:hypothetical protein
MAETAPGTNPSKPLNRNGAARQPERTPTETKRRGPERSDFGWGAPVGSARRSHALGARFRLGYDPQRTHPREIAIMGHESGGVDGQRAGHLNGVCELQAERGSQPRSAFRNIKIERDKLP